MDKKTKILQIGIEDWSNQLTIKQSEALDWYFIDALATDNEGAWSLVLQMKKRAFDVVLCTDQLNNALLESLSPLIESYALVVDQIFESQVSEKIKKTKLPLFLPLHSHSEVLDLLRTYFFSGQMGSKLHVHKVAVSDNFEGEVTVQGEHRLELRGNFSPLESSSPLMTWQYNMGMYGRSKKIWLEFTHSEDVEVSFIVQGIREGTSQIQACWEFTGAELKAGIEIKAQPHLGYLSLSLAVRGKGELKIGPLHYRDSRGPYGEYLLGGQKISDEANEELCYYFHPGDLQPPLNVYFSGYRSAEGFEGFYMMKKLGAPFLLITDPRLEGGSFYLGSPHLESSLKEVIESYLDQLNFSHQELILSGLSMGTFGALYYGSKLSPHSIIVGKPLVNLGSMAEKERIVRPGGFPTSLDVLQSLTGRQDKEGVVALNQRFWDSFDQSDFKDTQFLMAYMRDDDYDDQAYVDILERLSLSESRVIGKGIAGRHNDNSPAINQWFINHYQRILNESFYRGEKNEI